MARLYTIVPLPTGPFEHIDALSRLCFGLIWDRYRVSSYNVTGTAGDSPWYDEDQEEVFCLYRQDELARDMGCSERTVRRCLETLREAGIIWWRKAVYKGANRYFVDPPIREYLWPRREGK